MRILIALIVGVLAYFVAQFVFNQPLSAILGIAAGAMTFLGYDRV